MLIAETNRLILRHLQPADAGAVDRVFGDPEVMRYGNGLKTQQAVREWVRGYIEIYYAQWGFGKWAVVEKSSGGVIGYCGLSRFPDHCGLRETEIGYRLARAAWGRGLGTEAVCAVRDYGMGALALPRLIAMIDPGNVASIRVAEKAGFRYETDVMMPGYTHSDRLYAIGEGLNIR